MILLNDIFKFSLSDLENTKVRFNKANATGDPLFLFKTDRSQLQTWQFWNYNNKSYKVGNITIGFIRIAGDKWLLFDVSKVTKDLDKMYAMGYEYEKFEEYEKYCGRLIIEFKNSSQNLIRKATSVFEDCKVLQILDSTFDNDIFPGYEYVNVTWQELSQLINKDSWKTALENQKGIYLITDTLNGKMYVGSAYGTNMLHGRWSSYIKNGHGGNVELKDLSFDYIQKHFKYSILDIFKSTIDDTVIIKRESWWKENLMTRLFGYNKN